MKTTFLWIFVVVLAAASAQAACGGGGWKASTSTNETDHHTPERRPTATSTTTSQEVRYERHANPALPAAVVAAGLDTGKFDSNSGKLQLSEEQWNKVSKAKVDIRKQIDKLNREDAKARTKYNNCTGDCEDERTKVARTSDALKNYNAQREFESRLQGILHDSQLRTYKSL
jgi:hypothetical protein